MRIAILGATSQIAQDLILSFSINKDYDFSLFGRNVELLEKWVNNENLSDKYQVQKYSKFGNHKKYDVIINFVGIGDPAKAKKMGKDIFRITEQYDDMALEYLKQHKKTQYIFLSSGAVFGGNYQEPVDKDTVATIDINNLRSTDWYTIAKLYAEAKHRSLSDLSIVDVRLFNYFSHRQNIDARFLITDIVRAIKNQEIFKTSMDNIVRDYIGPSDFFQLIMLILKHSPTINCPIDVFSRKTIDKISMLKALESEFNFKYELQSSNNSENPSTYKTNYFSRNTKAINLGYKPSLDSLDLIIGEIHKILSFAKK